MPTQTERLAIATGAYTAVSNGHFNVLVKPVNPINLRLHVGQTAPPANTTHYLPISTSGVALSDLEGADKVYLMAETAGAEVVVIRGG